MKTLISLVTLFLILTSTAQAKDVDTILADIAVLTEKTQVENHRRTSMAVYKYSKMYGIDYKIVLGLIMTESSFRQGAVSRTQDFGIGQINYNVWSQEFIRLKKEPLDMAKLKTDADYAIRRTVEILSILKKSNDPYWVGRYHSKTPSLKRAYFVKVQNQVAKIAYKKNHITLAVNK